MRMRAGVIVILLFVSALVGRISIREVIWRFSPTVEQMVAIKDTNWVAQIRSDRCIFTCYASQGVDIRVVNQVSGNIVELVKGADVIEDSIFSDSKETVTITLNNLTLATINDVDVAGIHIIWNFVPTNDPENRAAHKAWVFGDKTLQNNRDWYCSHIFS